MVTTLTAPKVLGDIVRDDNRLRTYQKKIVAQNQTLVSGAAVAHVAGGQIGALGAPANCVQTIGITGTLSAGSFVLKFLKNDGTEEWTDPIAYDGDTAAVQAGVDTALGGSMVVVAGTAITAMTFTFSGVGYAGIVQQLIGIDISGLTGEEDTNVAMTTPGGVGVNAAVDAVHTVAMAGGSAGTYDLDITDKNNAVKTVTVPYDAADLAAVNTLIDAQLGAGAVEAGGTVHTAMTLTFDGDAYKGRPQTMTVLDATSWTGTSSAITETTKGTPETSGGCVGIMAEAITTGAGVTTSASVIVREAIVSRGQVTWGSGIVEDAIVALEEKGVLVRKE